jgi:predicted DNA-binding transcriptional regulator AlpA
MMWKAQPTNDETKPKDKEIKDLPSTGFVTPNWLKEYFSISNSTMYAWCASGYLPPMIAIGPRARRFRAEDIARFEAERVGSAKQHDGGSNG